MKTQLPEYLPGSEPIFHRGDGVGCLCLHGFGAAPLELKWLADDLAARGRTVYVPRLHGHGADHTDLTRVHWRDWYLCALDAYHVLQAQCEKVVIVGFSAGGALALVLASAVQHDALVVMATPVKLDFWQAPYLRWFKYVRPFLKVEDNMGDTVVMEQRRRGEPEVGRVFLPLWSVHALSQLHALTVEVQRVLPSVTTPLLAVYARNDTTIPYVNLQRLLDGVGSTSIEQHTLEESGHLLPLDVERETVFRRVGEFVERFS